MQHRFVTISSRVTSVSFGDQNSVVNKVFLSPLKKIYVPPEFNLKKKIT